jgi:hypothetical protein
MDPFEKYDMTFNGAAPTRTLTSSPGRYSGQDNGWVLSPIEAAKSLSGAMLERGGTRMKYFGMVLLTAALLTGDVAAALANPAPPPNTQLGDSGVAALALRWFKQMQAGRIDRTQLTPEYSAHLTDDAVRQMSRDLNRYGAPPLGAQIVDVRKIHEQVFYEVKFLFARGDETSLIFGLNAKGAITAVGLTSLSGD